MKKQWILMALVMVMAVGACAAMPVMAERLIAGSVGVVDIQQVPVTQRETTTLVEERPQGIALTEAAQAAILRASREAYKKVFGQDIPERYHMLERDAYEEAGSITFMATLMPEGWEKIADALGSTRQVNYYSVTFGGLDPQTGAGDVLGVQRFNMVFDAGDVPDVEYTAQQVEAMEQAARAFAQGLGYTPGAVRFTGKISGSFEQGLSFEFAMEGSDTITVNMSESGQVSGYSLVPMKG